MSEIKEQNELYWSYTAPSVFKFSFPSIIVVVFMSLYQAVDGLFLSNYVNSDALAAVNIICPLIGLFYALSLMFATGSVAMVAALLGENKNLAASQVFSMIMSIVFIIGIVSSVVLGIFFDECLYLLGTSAILEPYVSIYLKVLLLVLPLILLQDIFLFFLITVGKPNTGMIIVLIGGITNIVLDYLLIMYAGMGMFGAAIATATGYFLNCACAFIYFLYKKDLSLQFCRFKLQLQTFFDICKNGASEMVTNLATAVTTLLINYTAMQFFNEDGVAAVAIILYIDFFLVSLFIGYTSGILPLISYNYGANNRDDVNKLFNICVKVICYMGAISLIVCLFLSEYIAALFVDENNLVFTLTTQGLVIWGWAFPFMGINILASTIFTAFSDGRTSAIIALMRTGFFTVIFLLLLPKFFAVNGIWLSLPCAEICGFFVSLYYIISLRKKYGILK